MNIYTTDKIRNVVLLGHGGCGKTSLVEAMAYVSGLTTRIGKVADGNTISDYDKEEIKRKFSITTSVVPIIWEGCKINLLDAPGYFDFVGEAEEAVSAADAAIIVVSGKAGVEVGTQKAWELCDKYKLPRMVFVSEMDVDHASFRQVVEDLTNLYGKKIAPFYMPIRENEKFVGYINVCKMEGRRFTDIGKREPCPIPEYTKDNLAICREALMDAVAEVSDIVNTAARWMETASGIPLGEYQFTTYAFRRTDYQNGERTIWSVDCWQAPDGTDESSFHFIALLDAINGQLLSLRVAPPMNSGLHSSDSSGSLEQFQAIVPDLFDEMGLPAVESVQPAEDSSNNLAPVLISTASGNYRADYGVSEETAQLTFLALDGAFLI